MKGLFILCVLFILFMKSLYGESVTLNSHVKTAMCLWLCSDSKQAATLKKEEKAKCQKKIAEGQANRKIAAKYLKETIKR